MIEPKWSIPASLLVFFMMAAPASSAPIVFTDEASWLSALSAVGTPSIETEVFEDDPVGSLPAGTTDLGSFSVFVNAADGINRITGFNPIEGTRSLAVSVGDGSNPSLATVVQWLFDVPISGFFAQWSDPAVGDVMTMRVNGTTIAFDDYFTIGGALGVIDFAGITLVEFGTKNAASDFSNVATLVDPVHIARVAVPEPSTFSLVLAAIVLVAGRRLRLRGARPAAG